MSLNGIQNSPGVAALEPSELAAPAATQHRATNTTTAWSEGAAPPRTTEKPLDLFEALGALFNGQTRDGNAFDLGALLSSIFDFAGTQAKKEGPLPSDKSYAGVQERVEVSGETGDAHFKARGRAAAEAHAHAKSSSEVFVDGKNGVGVRGSAEASVGASAEVDGSVTTDIGSIDGRARVSAEAYARARGEAKAGPTGASATGLVETGVMAAAEAESNLQLADGLVKGHAEAQAEAGAGGKATGKVGLSYDPPEAVVNAKGEAFAGARAGYAAKGGAAGVSYGIEGEVWAGAGAKFEINGGLDENGKFKLEFCIGASVGVGAMVKFGIEFDTKEFGKAFDTVVGGLLKGVASLFGGGKGDGAHAARAVEGAVKQVASLAAANVQQAADEALEEEQHEFREERTSSVERHGTLLEGSLS